MKLLLLIWAILQIHVLLVEICFDFEDNVGTISYLCKVEDNLYMFWGPLGLQALTSYANGVICSASLKFHGSHFNVLTGILIVRQDRATLWGHKTDDYRCNRK